ncbi:hypothetical protein [Streptomyces scabiei]|uniref:IgA FC receptor n=1 Tax=Streptomyces scabiei TaxID=1930 RepID=A0A100JPI8_STRSC|nr:hypothetical protein [Streptomyces scabiei]GAQ63271.1 IgA FC receptor precursor [Streptomyces scabiei]
MRVLPVRRLAVSALGAALLLGVTAPAVLAADVGSAPERTRSAAPVPGADALQAQLKGLGDLGGVLKPVTELLDAVLKADDGRLSADRAAELGKAVRDAIDKARASAPATPPAAVPPGVPPVVLPVAPPVVPPVALPVDPTAPAVPPAADAPTVPAAPSLPSVPASPAAPVVPAAPALPLVPAAPPAAQSAVTLPAFDRGPVRSVGTVAADPVSDALTTLQTAVDSLLEAATSGDLAQVLPAANGVVAGLVQFVGATLLGSGLPAPLAVPPVAPSAELPVTPATDTLPVRPPAAAPGR